MPEVWAAELEKNAEFGPFDKETGYCSVRIGADRYTVRVVGESTKEEKEKLQREWDVVSECSEVVMAPKVYKVKDGRVLLVLYKHTEGSLAGAVRNAKKTSMAEARNITLRLLNMYEVLLAKCNLHPILTPNKIFLTTTSLATTDLLMSPEAAPGYATITKETAAMQSLSWILLALYSSMDEVVELGRLIHQMNGGGYTLKLLQESAWVGLCRTGGDDLLTEAEVVREIVLKEEQAEFEEFCEKSKAGGGSIVHAVDVLSTPMTFDRNSLGLINATVDYLGEHGLGNSARITASTPNSCVVYETCRKAKTPSRKITQIDIDGVLIMSHSIPATRVVPTAVQDAVLYHEYHPSHPATLLKKIIFDPPIEKITFCKRAAMVTTSDGAVTILVYRNKNSIVKLELGVGCVEGGVGMSIGMRETTVGVGYWVQKERKVVCKVFNLVGEALVPLEKDYSAILKLSKVTKMLLSDTLGVVVATDGASTEVGGLFSPLSFTQNKWWVSTFVSPAVLSLSIGPTTAAATTTSGIQSWDFATGEASSTPCKKSWTTAVPRRTLPPSPLEISPAELQQL